MNNELGAALSGAAAKSSPAIAGVTAVQAGVVPQHLELGVLLLTGVLVVVQLAYAVWKWRKEARKP